MSKHLKILPEVIENLKTEYPVIGVAYHGSALHGYARPDSDLDLIILIDAPGEYHNNHDVTYKGIVLCRSFFPEEWLKRILNSDPYIMWPFSQAHIEYDPDGLMTSYQSKALEYFNRKPGLVSAWRERTQKYKARKTDTSIEIDYRSWADFFAWLRDKYDVS